MIPNATGSRLGRDLTAVVAKDLPSRTYGIDFARGRVTGMIDGMAAVEQDVHKILRTERFTSLIYSWNYGVELNGGAGERLPVVESEIRRVLKEALLQDGRITAVRDIKVEQAGRRCAAVAFTVETVFGSLGMKETVGYG